MRRDNSRPGRRLAAFVVGMLLALALTEGIVRNVYAISYAYEPEIGWIHAPGVRRWAREGFAESHWTDHGIRRSSPLRADDPVLLVLGDSFTEALQVSDDEVYTSLLERRLRDGGRKVQVANAGRSTQSSADYVAHGPFYLRVFSPAWTVVQLRLDDFATDAWDATRTHFEPAQGMLKVVDVVPPRFAGARGVLWDARQTSMLLGYGVSRMGEYRSVADKEPPLFRAGARRASGPQRAEASYPVEDELDMLHRAYGGRVTLLLVPEYDPEQPLAQASLESRILAHCRARAMSCLTPRALYPRLTGTGRAPFGFPNSRFNAGHMNATGHGFCAEALTSELERVHALL